MADQPPTDPAALAPREPADIQPYRTLRDEGIEPYGGSLAVLQGQQVLVHEAGVFLSREFGTGVYVLARPYSPDGEVSPLARYTSFALPVVRVFARLIGDPEAPVRRFDPPLLARVVDARSTYTVE